MDWLQKLNADYVTQNNSTTQNDSITSKIDPVTEPDSTNTVCAIETIHPMLPERPPYR